MHHLTAIINTIIFANNSIMVTNNLTAGSKGALKQQKKKQVSYLNKLAAIIRSPLNSVERNKVVALITMEIHNRDVIERMVKANCSSVSDFEWLSQLRFIFKKVSLWYWNMFCVFFEPKNYQIIFQK